MGPKFTDKKYWCKASGKKSDKRPNDRSTAVSNQQRRPRRLPLAGVSSRRVPKKKVGAESAVLHSCWSGEKSQLPQQPQQPQQPRQPQQQQYRKRKPRARSRTEVRPPGLLPPPLRRWEEKVNLEPHRAGHHRRAHHHHYGRVSVKCHARGVRS